MRKNYTKILMVAVVLFTGVSTEAYAFNAEGIYYNITSEADTTVEVTSGSKGYAGDITIPVKVSYNGKVYTVASIGNKAFYYCRSLTSVNIPDSLTSIGEDAFYCCSNLESVILGDTLLTIGGKAFYYCSKLATIDIPDKVTSIGNSAFSGCSSLTRLGLGKSLSVIDSYAFYACSGLTEIYCAASVPPSCRSYCFLNVDKSACTLYVPEGTADDYRVADEWKDFYNIVETDFAGTEEIAADAAADVTVYAAAGRIVVENAAAGTPIAVYSADGMLIYGGTVSDTFTEIPAPAGKLYIVKCGSAVFKTVM